MPARSLLSFGTYAMASGGEADVRFWVLDFVVIRERRVDREVSG